MRFRQSRDVKTQNFMVQRPLFREEKNFVVNLLAPIHIIEHVIKNNGSASYRIMMF